MTHEIQVEALPVTICDDAAELGHLAAHDFARIVTEAVAANGEAAVILATGNSQLSFIAALHNQHIPWDRLTVFHMDEYIGLPADHPASFRRYIREKIAEVFHPKAVHYINGDTDDIGAELVRYTTLLAQAAPVLTVMGIGENGHLAFNDPPADFDTTEAVQIVTLDAACRAQQVGEGHFATVDDVPPQAVTLTIPALLKPPHVLTLVPESRKARAVKAALHGPVTPDCPASILRMQPHARLYLDRDSAALLEA
jgi:glucosamine-6-phosphate deaminase